MKGVVEFENKEKLSPHYVGIYDFFQKIGKNSYVLRLTSEFASVNPLFHVSMLKKCIGDTQTILPIEGLCVKENLSYEEVTIEILDRQVKMLKNKDEAFIKML